MAEDSELKSIKISADVHRQAKSYVAPLDISLQELTEKALLAWMGTPAPPADPVLEGHSKPNREALETLDVLMKSDRVAPEMLDVIRRTIAAVKKLSSDK